MPVSASRWSSCYRATAKPLQGLPALAVAGTTGDRLPRVTPSGQASHCSCTRWIGGGRAHRLRTKWVCFDCEWSSSAQTLTVNNTIATHRMAAETVNRLEYNQVKVP